MADTPKEPRTRARTADREDDHTDTVEAAPRTSTAVAPAPTRTVVGGAPVGALPLGFGAGTLAADVSGQLRAVAPTFSMSVVRKHFWQVASRSAGGVSISRKYGLSGCIPAVVSRTDGS